MRARLARTAPLVEEKAWSVGGPHIKLKDQYAKKDISGFLWANPLQNRAL